MGHVRRAMALGLLLLVPACATRPAVRSAADVAPPARNSEEPPLLVDDGAKILRIQRHRPLKPGDRYDIESHSVFDVEVKLPAVLVALASRGSRLESVDKHFDVSGRVEVVSMDPPDKPSAFTFTVKTCVVTGEELLPAGTVVDAKATPTGMTYTRRDGSMLKRQVGQALLGLFDQEKGAGAPPRGKDGSDVPHKIGETWPVELPPSTTRGVGEGSKVVFTDMRAWTMLKAMKMLGGPAGESGTVESQIRAVEVESGFSGVLHLNSLPLGF